MKYNTSMCRVKFGNSGNIHLPLTLLLTFLFTFCLQHSHAQTPSSSVTNIVFTSDAHYGITRAHFRGDTNVSGHRVNAAMIAKVNTLPDLSFPADGGVGTGTQIRAVDYLIQTGDIANRMEIPIQSAAISWIQFKGDYMKGLHLKGHNGRPAQLLLAPGNHDISNAIGYYKPMQPLTDPSVMVGMYNIMLHPKKQLTNQSYDYATDKINYSLNIKGIHLQFITLWPDSAERIWMQKDLDTVALTTPVIIFTHDQPTCEAKHFTNPIAPHLMSPQNKFENLTGEQYKESAAATKETATDMEQCGWVSFLKTHSNIKAYFHGNSNWNEFYTYYGPDHDVSLNVYRVDSPMKGKYSAEDETLLSFQLISIDQQTQQLTVRECLWNTDPLNPSKKIVFGKTKTMSLK